MTKPEVVLTPKRLYKVIVLFCDHSQEVNLRKLNLGDDKSVCKLVKGGRRRYFYFLFKNKWEADLLSDLYYQASLITSESAEDCNSDGDYDDDFEPSQDVLQIVREYSRKVTKSCFQPPIKEEEEGEGKEENSDHDGE